MRFVYAEVLTCSLRIIPPYEEAFNEEWSTLLTVWWKRVWLRGFLA